MATVQLASGNLKFEVCNPRNSTGRNGVLGLGRGWVALALLLVVPIPGFCLGQSVSTELEASAGQAAESIRTGYVVKVPLPLVGNRDAEVIQQIHRIAQAAQQGAVDRPIVVLQFESSVGDPKMRGGSPAETRGSQFERCLALARYLTDREAASLRLVAYLPSSVEGHAVLPVLACQELYMAPGIELGRAAIDAPADATVSAAYQDVVSRGRTNIPGAAVEAMLAPNIELRRVSLADQAGNRIVTLNELNRLTEEGKVTEVHETIWNGLGLAAFSAENMRNWLWISPTVQNYVDLASALNVQGSLRTVQQLPRDWNAVTVRIRDNLTRQRGNQIIRGLQEAVKEDQVNLIVIVVNSATSDFDTAARLADALLELRDKVYTTSIVENSIAGPIGLIPAVCNEVVLVGDATLGPDSNGSLSTSEATAQYRVIDHLSAQSHRPMPLLSVLADNSAVVNIYTHQTSGRREIFAERQIREQVDREVWLPKERLAGGGPIPQNVALQYGLVNAVDDSTAVALSRLGLEQLPEELSMPWIDSAIQGIASISWLPQLFLLIGMMALMVELGNPGIGLGALVSGLCFLGFFWIEGLNGNVDWLEILLFFGGLFALSIEVLVLPGFGIFGVTGLMMIFVSLVLAGQTFIWPSTSAELAQVASNLFWVALMAFGGMIGLLLMHERIAKLPFLRRLSLMPGGTEEIDEIEQREIVASYDFLLGQSGLTTTRLNPSGKAQFGSTIVSVVGSGGMIDAGAPVQVVEVRGNLIIVEEL